MKEYAEFEKEWELEEENHNTDEKEKKNLNRIIRIIYQYIIIKLVQTAMTRLILFFYQIIF